MKTLRSNFFCCSCRLYKIGLLIAIAYIIPNLFIIACFFGSDYDIYTLPFMCALTVLTSMLLIKGLIEERHELLLPWLSNITVLILFNIIFVIVQFGALNTKQSFYVEFALFVGLELQILCWYIIYSLLKAGYQKNKRFNSGIGAISKIVHAQDKDNYKVNIIANEHVAGDRQIITV